MRRPPFTFHLVASMVEHLIWQLVRGIGIHVLRILLPSFSLRSTRIYLRVRQSLENSSDPRLAHTAEQSSASSAPKASKMMAEMHCESPRLRARKVHRHRVQEARRHPKKVYLSV